MKSGSPYRHECKCLRCDSTLYTRILQAMATQTPKTLYWTMIDYYTVLFEALNLIMLCIDQS